VKSLIQEDASLVNKLSADGFPPLSLATFFANHDIVILLLAHRADPNVQSQNQIRITALHSAVERRDQTLVEILLSHGANPNATEFLGGTPLHSAATGGMDSIARTLVRHGADPTLKMNDGRTAPELAEAGKHAELAAWLKR
jgi:ankyrin repeat protein